MPPATEHAWRHRVTAMRAIRAPVTATLHGT